ncbi:MAG: hypothetical protein JWR80_7689, partial [Bradyrhizobium sp.]|nr:hypothetical protein [Bradyrhizobium sp.]
REDRVRAAPAVSCANGGSKCAHEHTGSAETLRPSLRNGFTAYAALSSATNSFCHRRQQIKVCQTRLGLTRLRWLSISNGGQDHTVLPYVKAWVVYAPHIAHEVHLALRPPLRARRRRVHRIQPRVRDDRDTPLCGVDGDKYAGDLGRDGMTIFSANQKK